MAKQLNVNLSFTADTNKAKQQIQELQNALNQVTKVPLELGQHNMTKELQEASIAAQQLKNHIQAAVNVDTGALDFSKLNASFKKSGVSMSEYAQKIAAIGPTGQKALSQLASAINQAEIPMRRTNVVLKDMMTTLKNTARWQLSSSMLHGFVGAVQSAYGYAERLNESLNNIRIVTGQTTEEMAVFAEQANKAAKSLSASTIDYTDASLIYYQQGLSAEEVTKRAEVTVKMANVVGQSAQTVSQQLTAIWNNFDDGSKSLEYYADVLTALGAATASSSDEIADGLEKFAAIGDTIGLSYEYAAAALATITSNTRQSADVVGTALKTIFARIQSLKLGETLEDGVDLTKYTEAMASVGVSVLDQNHNLKDMNTILDETAARWNKLDKAQQVALAQSVAGVRQYTQFIALMDNWNNGDNDSMMANVKTATEATGTLQKQADIYAESWEAANKRVKAALEGVYQSLLKDDFFIGLLDGIAEIIEFVDRLIDSLGGLGGVLSTVSVLLMKTFSNEMAQKLRDMAYNIQMKTEVGRNKVAQEKNQQAAEIGNILSAGSGGEGSIVGSEIANQYEQQRQMQQQLAENQEKMSADEIAAAQQILDIRKQIGEQIIKARQDQEEGHKKSSSGYEGAINQLAQNALDADDLEIDKEILLEFEQYKNLVKESEVALVNLQDTTQAYQNAQQNLNSVMNNANATEEMREDAINKVKIAEENLSNAVMNTTKVNNGNSISTEQAQKVLEKLKTTLDGTDDQAEQAAQAMAGLSGVLRNLSAEGQSGMTDNLAIDQSNIDNMVDGWRQTAHAANEAATQTLNAEDAQKLYEERLKASKATVQDWAQKTVTLSQGLMSMVSIVNSARGAINTLTNPDASGWEKFSAVLMSFCSIVMMTTQMIDALKLAKKLLNLETLKGLATKAMDLIATGADALATTLAAKAEEAKAKTTKKATAETEKETAANTENAASELADAAATEVNNKAKGKLGGTTKSLSGSTKSLGGSFKNLGSSMKGLVTSVKSWASANAGLLTGIGLIAAGVAVAVGAIAWGINQYNKYENAAREAAIQAEKAAAAYQAVSQAYSEFTGNLDAYKNARNGLEDLTEGTVEFKSAVLEANEAAIKLLNTYEGLQYTVDENGLITINEESMNMVQEQQMEKVQNAQQSSMLATQNARNKRLEADSKQFQRDNLNSSQGMWANVGNTAAATGAGAGSGALIGAGIGSIVPGIGTAIGAGVGAIIGAVGGLLTGIIGSANAGSAVSEEQEALNKLAQVYEKEGNARFADDQSFKELLKEQGIEDDALVNSLVENRASTMELVAQMAENSAAISAMNEQMISGELGEQIAESFKGEGAEELAAQTTEAMGVALEQRSAQLYEDKYKDKLFGITDADIQKQYAEAMGWDAGKTENKFGNKATYYDKEGNVVAEDLSDEVARQFLAQQAALQELESSMPFYVDAVQSLADAGNALSEGVGTAIASFAGGDGGNLNTLTAEDFKTVEKTGLQANKNEDGKVISFSFNGEVIDDEKAKLLGYETAEAFYDAFNNEIKRVEKAWEEIEIDFKKVGLDPEIINNLSLEAAQKFQESLEQMNYGALGDEGAQAYVDGIEMITETLNMGEADVASFIEQLGEVDWSDWYAMDSVNALLENMGYELDLTTEEMQEFINTMRQVGGASPVDVLEKTWKNAEILADELKEGIPPGSILDEEKYKAVIESNGALEDSFMKMMDGTYKYVGSGDIELDDIGMKETLERTREMSKLYEEAKEDASNINFSKFATMDYVSNKDLEEAENAISSAKDAQAIAQADMDGFHPINHKKYEAALNQAKQNTAGAEQHLTNITEQRGKDLEAAQEAIQAVQDSEYLKDVAEYNGWTEEAMNDMLEGIKNGEDSAMEQMKLFSEQMNKFMAAGDSGLYDVSAAEEKIASMATSIEELDELTREYQLSTETVGKAMTGLFASAAAEAQTIDELNSLMNRVQESGGEVDMEVYLDNLKRIAEEGMAAATSLEELQTIYMRAKEYGAEIDYNEYAENLMRLAEGYENCAEEVKKYQSALANGTDIKEAEEALETSIMIGEAAEKYGLEAKAVERQAKRMAKAYEISAEEAAKLAIQNQRMNKGMITLAENWDDWGKTLKSSDKLSTDWAEAAVECTAAIADLVGASQDLELPDEFFNTENLALLEAAMNGDINAVNKLGAAVAAATVDALEFNQAFADLVTATMVDNNIEMDINLNTEQFDADKAIVMAGIENIKNGIIGAGGEMDANWVAALNRMALTTGMSVEQMNGLLGSLGVQAKVTTTYVKQPMEVPTYIEHVVPQSPVTVTQGEDENGNPNEVTYTPVKKYSVPGEPMKVEGFAAVAQISTEDNPLTAAIETNTTSGGTPTSGATYTGNRGPIAPSTTDAVNNAKDGGKKSGGGGEDKEKRPTKPTKVKPTEKKEKGDEVERYHEINEVLDDLQNNLDEIGNLKDEVWGKDKLAAMDQERAKLVEITKAQKKYQDEIAKNLNDDKWAAGQVGAQFDENGRITNFEELQEQWLNEWNAQAAAFDAQEQDIENRLAAAKDAEDEDLQEQLEEEKDTLSDNRDKADKEYEEKRRALEQYEETLNLSEEAKAQLDDYFRQIRQLNYEQLQYKIELSVEINESDLADVEHKLNRLSETDIYSSAERIATIGQNAELQKNLAKTYIDGIAEATQKYNAYLNGDLENGIDQASYIEMLQENKANLQDVEMSIREGIEQIGDELESAFDLADERLDKQYAKFDQLIELMDHYKNIVSLTKGEAAYKELNDVLRASQTVIKNRIAADEAEVALWKNKRAELEAEIASGALTGEALEQANESLDAIIEKEAEANSQLRADIEQLGEYAREIFENSIEQAAKSFETEMFGGSLSGVIESIEMMNSRQEELLTTTNKIYETNKLIRNVEKDIEATTNNRAKQAYAEFQNKVRQKQEQNELTKFELDLLTAEYEMTKAQIALEEAQEAKDTVRLTRDSEGNYGYVYTANQDKVSDAEQQLEDATNSYYNTAMDGAQKYQDQIYQHIQEWEEKTKEVYLDQTLSEEEKNAKIKEINDTYNTLITQDKQLFYIAKAAMEESSYQHQVDYDLKGIESAEKWFTASDGYLNDLEIAQNEYDHNTEEVADHTERNFGKMSTAIENAKTKSEDFRDEVTGPGGLASELETTLTNAIGTARDAWKEYLEVLKDVVTWTDKAMKQNSQENDITMADDYSQLIIDEIKANGENADEEYIERLLNERDKKLNGIDLQDYSALIANAEDEATAEAWKRMRDRKIENMRKENYTQMLYDYLATDGASLDDQKAQNILTMRQHKIWGLGITDAISNEELIQQILNNQNTQNQSSTDTAQEATPEQYNSDPGSGIKNGASMKFISFTGKAYTNTNGGFVDNGYWPQNQSDLGNVQNQKFNESDKTWYLQSSKYPDKWFKQGDIQAFLTGGYTGAWGPEGRLAMLHEKELVLNKRDTENFLTATNILREISNMLDTNALIASLGAFNLKAMTLNSPADQVLQQEVTIHADFPNVTDHNEIELAIDNLINAASQHAYRM